MANIARKQFPISGAGGDDGGGGSKKGSGESDENTLRSRARASLIEIISEGEIGGLIDGAKSIYFDTTPLQNSDDSFNFEDVDWFDHVGLPDEGFFRGHNAVESGTTVNLEVKSSTGPVLKNITNVNADALRVIIKLPALFSRDADKGTVHTTSVSYAIDVMQSPGGTWDEVILHDISNEKTVSPTQIAHRVPLPELTGGNTSWDVRVRRITADSADENLQNKTFWDSYVELVEGKFIYPYTAAIALEVDAESMGSSLPSRSYHVQGLKIKVPSNYNPTTRAYDGIWNGNFVVAYTNNPAWVFYDLITNDRYGLGEFVDAAAIDKWSLYQIAQYCDELVATGYKDEFSVDILEPRYTFNGVINSADEAYFVLQQIATTWRGMGYWALGKVFATADMPTDPIRLVSKANIVGKFEYSGTSFKARHSVLVVQWNDPNDFYRPAKEVIIDDDMLARFGWREKVVQLKGCTSRGLAHRYGKWILDTEKNETETVAYVASWDHANARPGDVIAISDKSKALVRSGGRIVSYDNATTVVIDNEFVPSDGETYDISVTLSDGTIEKREITNFSGTTLTIQSAFSLGAVDNTMFAITGTDLAYRQYRVLSVEETEKNLFKVTGLFHDPAKYARVESDIVFDPIPYTYPDSRGYQPTDLDVQESGYSSDGGTHSVLTLSWSNPLDMIAFRYRVYVETPTQGRLDLGETDHQSIEITDIEAGDYIFFVRAIGPEGIVSPKASITYTALGSAGIPLPTVVNLKLADRPSSTEFVTTGMSLVWDNQFSQSIIGGQNSNVSPYYKENTVRIYDSVSTNLLRTQRVTADSYHYEFNKNLADSVAQALGIPSRSLDVEVTVTDIFDRTSIAATGTFVNNAPAKITPTVVQAIQTVTVNWPTNDELDLAGSMVWISDTSGIDPTAVTPDFDGLGNTFTFHGDPNTTYYLIVTNYDHFGKSALNYSDEISFTSGSIADQVGGGLDGLANVISGTGQGTISDIVDRINQSIAELGNSMVDNQVISFDQRITMQGEINTASGQITQILDLEISPTSVLATSLTSLTGRVGDSEADIVDILNLDVSLDGSALGTSLISLTAQIGDAEGSITDILSLDANINGSVLAQSITAVEALSNQGTATGLFEVRAESGPAGVYAQVAAYVGVTVDNVDIDAGFMVQIFEDSPGSGTYNSLFAVKANQFAVANDTGSVLTSVFEIIGDVTYIKNAVIKDLTTTHMNAGSIDLGVVGDVGTVITDLLAAKAATQVAYFRNTSGVSVPYATSNVVIATKSITAYGDTSAVEVYFSGRLYSPSVDSSAHGNWSVELFRDTVLISGTKMSSFVDDGGEDGYLNISYFDESPGTSSHTYEVKADFISAGAGGGHNVKIGNRLLKLNEFRKIS